MSLTRLEKFYKKVVSEDLVLLYNFTNISRVPSLERAIFHSTSKSFSLDKLPILEASSAIFLSAGQLPRRTQALKSIAFFSIRQGNLLGVFITLRKKNLFDMLDKLLIFVLPKLLSSKESKVLEIVENILSKKVEERKSTFVIGCKQTTYFPETTELLTFFNSLKGFSFDCSSSLENPLFLRRTLINEKTKSQLLYKRGIKRSRGKKFDEKGGDKRPVLKNKSGEFLPGNLIASKVSILYDRASISAKKRQLLSAFGYPISAN